MDMWPEVFGADSRIPAICGKEKSWEKAEIIMEQKKNRLHYAWFILAGCCILQGATLGLINNCAGVFYSPICKELGFEMGKTYDVPDALLHQFCFGAAICSDKLSET